MAVPQRIDIRPGMLPLRSGQARACGGAPAGQEPADEGQAAVATDHEVLV
jgi:hypothetical protein